MGNINWSRVFIGGVVAGLAFLVLDWANMYVLGMDYEAWAREHNLAMPPMWIWVAMDIVFGIMLVWLYAAIRPRFGAGSKTALTAGAFFWVFFAVMYFGWMQMGLFTQAEYLKSAAWGVVSVVVASLVGAWLYQENTTA